MSAEKVINICPVVGEGEHKVIVLTSEGRMFERLRDPKGINYRPGEFAAYYWKPVAGPLDEATK